MGKICGIGSIHHYFSGLRTLDWTVLVSMG